jgi:dTDP-4-dehydrorhamnose 3,5-epimerase-like enzyme
MFENPAQANFSATRTLFERSERRRRGKFAGAWIRVFTHALDNPLYLTPSVFVSIVARIASLRIHSMKVVKNIKPEFKDARGAIFKILDDGKTAIKSVLIITSKKGSVRSNHYHKKDAHYLYMLTGKMEYRERNVAGGRTRTRIIKKGNMVYTPPKMIHTCIFLEDSSFLTLATQSRSQKHYERDTVRVAPV